MLTPPTLIPAAQGKAARFHRAKWILIDPWTIIENGCVEIKDQVIAAVHRRPVGGECIDHGQGVLMPPLVNAHLHLELSALHNRLSYENGFDGWVKELLEKRAGLTAREMKAAILKQSHRSSRSGTLWVGDIASLDMVEPLAEILPVKGVFFKEILGVLNPDHMRLERGKTAFSMAGHAPHTTSPQVLKFLKRSANTKGLPFSIHLAESDIESEFILDPKTAWGEFLKERGIDPSAWEIRSKTPVGHAYETGLLDENTIAVHLLNISKSDLQLLRKTNTTICLCPRSNWNLHQKLPDIDGMLTAGLKPALGTDSLASCDSLDMFDEMAFVMHHYKTVKPEQVLAMATLYGAKTLGIERFTGRIEPGKSGDMVYVPVHADTEKQMLEQVIIHEH